MVGSEFATKRVCPHGANLLWCNGVRNAFLAHFRPIYINPQSSATACLSIAAVRVHPVMDTVSHLLMTDSRRKCTGQLTRLQSSARFNCSFDVKASFNTEIGPVGATIMIIFLYYVIFYTCYKKINTDNINDIKLVDKATCKMSK